MGSDGHTVEVVVDSVTEGKVRRLLRELERAVRDAVARRATSQHELDMSGAMRAASSEGVDLAEARLDGARQVAALLDIV